MTKNPQTQQDGGDATMELQDVLDAYAMTEPGPNLTTLAEWTRRFPQYRRELSEFTAQWQLLEWENGDESVGSAAQQGAGAAVADGERRVLRGISIMQSVYFNTKARRAAEGESRSAQASAHVAESRSAPEAVASTGSPMSGLFEEASRAGMDADGLSRRLGLTVALVTKLDRRLLAPLSIPNKIVEELAAALGRGLSDVTAYLRRPPSLGIRVQHLSKQAPQPPKQQEDFFDAVRHDSELDEARRGELLTLPRPPDPGASPATRQP